MTARSYEIIGAPFDLGSTKRGCDQAPSTLRENGLTKIVQSLARRGVPIVDGGDVAAPSTGDGSTWPKNLPQLLTFSDSIMARLAQSYSSGHLPVVIGGDHSVSIPSVSAAAAHLRNRLGPSADLGLVWVDAHPDLETPETTQSGDLHGTSVAHLLGYGEAALSQLGGFRPKLDPRNVVLIGLRDVMSAEGEIIRERGIRAYTASDVERDGIAEICRRTFEILSGQTDGYVLSFDIDACDPSDAPGVEYPERGGLTFREARLIMELAAEAPRLMSFEFTEINPSLDPGGRTAQLAIELIRSAVLGSPL